MQVPAFAGGAPSGRRDSGNSESAPASEGSPDHHGYDRGRHPDPCAQLHQNREQRRDPEMHQTKKGKNWYFGMKAHVGVDSKTKIIHSAVATAANVSDV